MNTAVGLPYLLENDRVNRWYYRDAPPIGAVVMFTHETYIDQVARVTLTHVWLVSGRALLRPFIARRLVRWSIHQYRTRKHRTTNRQWIDTRRHDWSVSTAGPHSCSNSASQSRRPDERHRLPQDGDAQSS